MASAAAVATNISTSPDVSQAVDDGSDLSGGVFNPNQIQGRRSEIDNERGSAGADKAKKQSSQLSPASLLPTAIEKTSISANDDDAALFGSGSERSNSPDSVQPGEPGLSSQDGADQEDEMETAETDDDADPSTPLKEDEALDIDLGRAPVPESADGQLYLLKMPQFFGIEPVQFHQSGFKAPTNDHHARDEPATTFSAYKTAMTTIRWRRSPSERAQLQSNTRIVRWSDGSYTLQFAHKPATHYPMVATPLGTSSSQSNPPKSATTHSQRDSKKSGRGVSKTATTGQDAFTYVAAPQELAGLLRVTNKITTGLKVQSAMDASAEALERLQNSLAAAATNSHNDDLRGDSGISMVRITEDPEMAKRKAELAEKEKMRASKRREAQEMRDRERHGKGISRRGLGHGLTLGGLEGDEGGTRLPGSRGRQRKTARTQNDGEIYSDDSEYAGRGRTREDEYDVEDDFLAPSDEEEEASQRSSSEDAENHHLKSRPAARRQMTPKRSVQDAEGDVEERATGNAANSASPTAKPKRRRVLEEDDDE